MRYLQEQIREKIIELFGQEFQIQPEDILFSIPPNRKFGDLSTPLPFAVAKKLKQKPFPIGQRIIAGLKEEFDIFQDLQMANGGFVNFYLDKSKFLNYLWAHKECTPLRNKRKVIVEHTSINPNKSAHIGHLRNSCLGDTLVKSLDFLGYEVEVQNYIDDTGIQVADVVWAVMFQEKLGLEEIKKIDNLATYLWKLYTEANVILSSDEEAKAQRNEVHKKIEDKVEPEYSISYTISQEVLKDHIRVMKRLGIQYQLLVKESDIMEFDFFKEASDTLKEQGILYPSKDPEKEGCWVIKYVKENNEKIVVRSNGTITYIGKDIGYTFWKVGLFQRDFTYSHFYTYPDQSEIFITDRSGESMDHRFGNGERVYNVIDVRQSYPQNVIKQVLGDLKTQSQSREFNHFSYEMVALTPQCCKDMDLPLLSEDENKSYVELSGRKGIAISADELIDRLIEKSVVEVKKRDEDLSEEKIAEIARQIAIGALRYFMIKFNSNSVIAFDFKDALATEGDTGPYLQYCLVRINSILRKLGDFENKEVPDIALLEPKELEIYFDLLLHLSQLEVSVEFALQNHEVSAIANFTYTLCQKFNHYYHLFPIVSEKNEHIQQLRIHLLLLVKQKLHMLFGIMGIPIPEKM